MLDGLEGMCVYGMEADTRQPMEATNAWWLQSVIDYNRRKIANIWEPIMWYNRYNKLCIYGAHSQRPDTDIRPQRIPTELEGNAAVPRQVRHTQEQLTDWVGKRSDLSRLHELTAMRNKWLIFACKTVIIVNWLRTKFGKLKLEDLQNLYNIHIWWIFIFFLIETLLLWKLDDRQVFISLFAFLLDSAQSRVGYRDSWSSFCRIMARRQSARVHLSAESTQFELTIVTIDYFYLPSALSNAKTIVDFVFIVFLRRGLVAGPTHKNLEMAVRRDRPGVNPALHRKVRGSGPGLIAADYC